MSTAAPVISSNALVDQVSISTAEPIVVSSVSVSTPIVGVSLSTKTADATDMTGYTTLEEEDQLLDFLEAERQEDANFKKAGQEELAKWQKRLSEASGDIDKIIAKAGAKGKMTMDLIVDVDDQFKSYKELKKEANQRLAFYKLRIPSNNWELDYTDFSHYGARFTGDDKAQNVRRFIARKTGKDVKVEMGFVESAKWFVAGSGLLTIFGKCIVAMSHH